MEIFTLLNPKGDTILKNKSFKKMFFKRLDNFIYLRDLIFNQIHLKKK